MPRIELFNTQDVNQVTQMTHIQQYEDCLKAHTFGRDVISGKMLINLDLMFNPMFNP